MTEQVDQSPKEITIAIGPPPGSKSGPANIAVGDSVGAVVTKGPQSDNPGEVIDIPAAKPTEMKSWDVTLQAFPNQVRAIIEQHCQQKNLDVGSYLSGQILSMMRVYQMKMCPFCATEKMHRAAALAGNGAKATLERERFRTREKQRIRRERGAARAARRRNRA